MMQQAGCALSRDQLLRRIGQQALESGGRAIDSHIENMRRKIGNFDAKPDDVVSIFEAGYRFFGNQDRVIIR